MCQSPPAHPQCRAGSPVTSLQQPHPLPCLLCSHQGSLRTGRATLAQGWRQLQEFLPSPFSQHKSGVIWTAVPEELKGSLRPFTAGLTGLRASSNRRSAAGERQGCASQSRFSVSAPGAAWPLGGWEVGASSASACTAPGGQEKAPGSPSLCLRSWKNTSPARRAR